MKPKKIKVYIKTGYHVESKESGKYQEYWVANCDKNMNPYEFALYKLSDSDDENPGGYMVAIPAMMENIGYKKCYKIIEPPTFYHHSGSLYQSFRFKLGLIIRYIVWFFIDIFMSKRVERERLMKLAQLMEKKETLFYKWSPEQYKLRLYIKDNTQKSTDLYDEMFFK
jgi:hypothetical protein